MGRSETGIDLALRPRVVGRQLDGTDFPHPVGTTVTGPRDRDRLAVPDRGHDRARRALTALPWRPWHIDHRTIRNRQCFDEYLLGLPRHARMLERGPDRASGGAGACLRRDLGRDRRRNPIADDSHRCCSDRLEEQRVLIATMYETAVTDAGCRFDLHFEMVAAAIAEDTQRQPTRFTKLVVG
jgi:hypothetical protein